MKPLSRATLLRLLSALHGVPPARETALIGRVQHLQRMGFPAGVNVGSGQRAEYDAPALVRILFAFELMQFGLRPERAVMIVRAMGWELAARIAGRAGEQLCSGLDPREYEEGVGQIYEAADLVLFDPLGLIGLGDPKDEGWATAQTLLVTPRSELAHAVDAIGLDRRHAVFNATHLLIEAALYLSDNEGLDLQSFGKALRDWAIVTDAIERDD